MISIKRYLEQRRGEAPGHDVLDAALQMGRLLLDTLAMHMVRGRESDYRAFSRSLATLQRQLEAPPTALNLLEISSEAAEALETYGERTAEYLRQQNEEMQSMLAMMTETLADIAGQSDASVARLQAVEHEIVGASRLEDMRALSASLEKCLTSVREAVIHQKRGSAAMVKRLGDKLQGTRKPETSAPQKPAGSEIDIEPEPDVTEEPAAIEPVCYVAAFKIQRADHIAGRFGPAAKQQMLSLVSSTLKGVLGTNDRLLRWKGTAFVLFLNSSATLNEVRVLIAETVARIGQQYIEVGKNSALISVGVDWTVFPQAQCPSLDAVFREVDAFLAGESGGTAPVRN